MRGAVRMLVHELERVWKGVGRGKASWARFKWTAVKDFIFSRGLTTREKNFRVSFR